MGLFGFVAKLGLDTSEFDAGIERARAKASKNLTGNLFKGFVTGAGAFTVLRNLSEAITQSHTEFIELAKANDIALDKMFELDSMAKQQGISFDDLKRKIESTGKTFKEFAANTESSAYSKASADSAERLNAGSTFMSNLWSAQKRAMMDGLSGLFESILGDGKMWESLSEKFGAPQTAQARATGEIFGPSAPTGFITSSKTSLEYGQSIIEPRPNALQSIGAYSGVNMQISEQRTTNQILRTIEGNTRTFKNGRLVSETLADESTY